MHAQFPFFNFCLLVPQIILALGNYMNSSKRGAVYGFKLQSLDLVSCFLLLLQLLLKSLFFLYMLSFI